MGNLYISDPRFDVVRQVAASGIITTVVGSGAQGYDGPGPGTQHRLKDVYDGPGAEGRTVASSVHVPADPNRARLVTVSAVPCLRVLRSRFPAGGYVTAVRRNENPPVPAPQKTYEALVRRSYVVDLVPLTARSCDALEVLVAGGDVAHAAAASGAAEARILA